MMQIYPHNSFVNIFQIVALNHTWKVKVLVPSDPHWTAARQAPLSLGFCIHTMVAALLLSNIYILITADKYLMCFKKKVSWGIVRLTKLKINFHFSGNMAVNLFFVSRVFGLNERSKILPNLPVLNCSMVMMGIGESRYSW